MKTDLECPCCGCEGAESDDDGMYYDGQPVLCGCNISVSVDEDGVDLSWNDTDPCPVCDKEEVIE